MADEGAAGQLAVLHDFFTALPYWRMQPFSVMLGNAVALAEPGQVYVAYLPRGGSVSMDLSAAKGPLTARWLNPRTGQTSEALTVAGGTRGESQAVGRFARDGEREFTPPGKPGAGNDWVLILEAKPIAGS